MPEGVGEGFLSLVQDLLMSTLLNKSFSTWKTMKLLVQEATIVAKRIRNNIFCSQL